MRIVTPALMLLALAMSGTVLALDAPQAPALNADTVVARQGAVTLTIADIDSYTSTLPPGERAMVFAAPERSGQLLEGMLRRKRFLLLARERHLDQTPEVAARLEAARQRILAQAGQEALRQDFEQEAPDMNALAEERYLAHPEAYVEPQRVDVRHILIGTKARSAAEAEALAERLRRELDQDPERFQALVDEYSDDASKESNGGLITNATDTTRLIKSFADAAATLTRVGEITGPVQTRYGYHLLRAEKIQPARQLSLDEVRDDLRKKLLDDWLRDRMDHDRGQHSAQAVVPDKAVLDALRTRYAPQGGDS